MNLNQKVKKIEEEIKERQIKTTNETIKKFNKIGKTITETIFDIENIYIEEFPEEEMDYIVVEFKGGGKCVRNATGNSLIASLREMTKLLNGGYYNEIDNYNRLKKTKEKL